MAEGELEAALKSAQKGNRDAFGLVYGQFSRRVLGLCQKLLGSRADAEDATSEVFERAHKALGDYDLERPFEPWILTVASRYCLNLLRRSRTERRLFRDEELEAPAPNESSSPLTVCENREQREQLRCAIDALPENYRIPLVLKYYGDLSYQEIAEHLGTTRNNVAVLLHRAKRALRASVGEPQGETP